MDMRLQHGFSLVEVLVTLLVLKLGMLGVLAGQTLALRQITDATQRTHAVALSAELISHSQLNPSFLDFAPAMITVDDAFTAENECDTANACNSAELATYQLSQWQQQLQIAGTARLFTPEICLTASGSSLTLNMSWQNRATKSVEDNIAACYPANGRAALQLQAPLR